MKTTEDRLRSIEAENEHLKAKLNLLGAGNRESMFSIPDKLAGQPLSISGLQASYLQVNIQGEVINANTKMAELLGTTKDQIIGKKLAEIDTIPWAKGVFATLLHESQLIGDEVEFETSTVDPISGLT